MLTHPATAAEDVLGLVASEVVEELGPEALKELEEGGLDVLEGLGRREEM
jgi:hypothetical protein